MGRRLVSSFILTVLLLIGIASATLADAFEHSPISTHECCDFSKAIPHDSVTSAFTNTLFYPNLIWAAILLVSLPVYQRILSKPPPPSEPTEKIPSWHFAARVKMRSKNSSFILNQTVMKKFSLLAGLIVLSLAVIAWVTPSKDLSPLLETADAKEVTVYKTATCGCCEVYTEYLENLGFEVHVENVTDMDAIKEKYEVPEDLLSCHTTIIGDYFVEGHMPVEGIEKLLTEQPDIKGIGMPGMPSGTPGMPGAKTETYEIQQVTEEGYSLFLSL